MNLSAPINATIATGQGVGTIINDDQYAEFEFVLSPGFARGFFCAWRLEKPIAVARSSAMKSRRSQDDSATKPIAASVLEA